MASNPHPNDNDNADGTDEGSTAVSVEEALAIAIQKHQRCQFAEAASIYRMILAAIPDQVDALHFLGVAESQLGHSKLALQLLGQALALVPEHADALNNRGNVLREMGRLDEAEADYRRSLVVRPRDAGTLSNLGVVLRARGDLEGAIAMLHEAVTHNPKHTSAWQNLGSTLETAQRKSEAVEAYREAARLSPESASHFYRMGFALASVGRTEEAADAYRRCLALDPNHAGARHLLVACTGVDTPSRASDDYVRSAFDTFAADFDTKLARLEYRGPTIVNDAVGELFPDPGLRLSVLDAGCGTGLCGPLLRPRASTLAGVDLSSAMVALAGARGIYDSLEVAELTSYLRGHPRTCDLIVSADTLVYFGDLREVLVAAAGTLHPEGAVVFTLECAEPQEAPLGYRINPHGRYSHTRDYVLGVLGEAGFVNPVIRAVETRKEFEAWVSGWLVSARAPS
jgi:predicted TPR repeat methyltransferase